MRTVVYRFYDDETGEVISSMALGTYEVTATTVDINSTSDNGRTVEHMTINYVIRRDNT